MSESMTITTESGAFIRKTIRKGNKRHIETKRMRKNEKKVVLGHIGDFEVYLYPYDFPDVVFMGEFPVSTQIEKGSEEQLFRAYNLIRAYFDGKYYKNDGRRKPANARRRTIKKAFNLGLNEQIDRDKARKNGDSP